MESIFVTSTTSMWKKVQLWRYVLWFPKLVNAHIKKFKWQWLCPYRIQYCLLNNIVLLVILDKFDPNLILVNVNKLKAYQYVKQCIELFELLKFTIFVNFIQSINPQIFPTTNFIYTLLLELKIYMNFIQPIDSQIFPILTLFILQLSINQPIFSSIINGTFFYFLPFCNDI
jgi:hypothetical protein